ncbi:MAG: hypothetical protein IT353_10715 [Gemmatimonadaceae bacterium]|nr:hypothetical protein [Gemmatimonadaceae bacterium]
MGDRADRASTGPAAKDAGKEIGAAVVVTFTEPRDVHAVVMRYDLSRDGVPTDSLLLPRVTRLVGRVQGSRNDSLMLVLTEAKGDRGRESFDGKRSAVIARDSRAHVVVLDRRPSRSAGILLGALTGMLIVGGAFVLLLQDHLDE